MSLARRALRHPSFVVGASLSLLLTAAALLSLCLLYTSRCV